MSHLLLAADRRVHARIVGVALAVAVVFVTALFAAGVGVPDGVMVTANAPTVVKAEKATTWSNDASGRPLAQ